MPAFGQFREERYKMEKKILAEKDLLKKNDEFFAKRPDNRPEGKVPTIKVI